jgi:predicted DNA-binding transcriptional regulator YafY
MLSLYNTYKEVILESVQYSEIEDAIEGKYAVLIRYAGPDGKGSGERLIVPYALGVTTSGHKVLRAAQEDGESASNKPNAWKFFRVDRITAWEPWKEYKNKKAHNGFNPNWDKSMAWVQKKAKY